MQNSHLEKLVLGVVCTLAGFFLIIFREEIKERRDNWNERVPWFLQVSPSGGRVFTTGTILFGVVLIYVGIAQLISIFT